MRIAIYARASAREDDPEIQLAALRAFAQSRGFLDPLEFVDRGVEGPASETGLGRLLRAVARREVGAVACTGLDRLARSVRHMIEVGAVLQRAGVLLIALNQGIDTSDEGGFLRALAALREVEEAGFREHTIAGLHRAGANGVRMGRPRALDAASRAQAERLLIAGRSQREIAQLLHIGRTTLQREFGTVPRSKPSASGRRSETPLRVGPARKGPTGRRSR